MTRIVAGSAKGRTLKVPPKGTRPTSERVREALFSRLEHLGYIEGCEVLDLYAGSGALGLEAASRGASYVECVESSRTAAQLIRSNVRELGLDVVVTNAKAETWLAGSPNRRFDLVIADPPYELGEEALAAVLKAIVAHVADDALVVVERSVRSPEPAWPEEFELNDERRWGDTRAWSAFATPSQTRLVP
ncbi:16S rRNA (guanine(966)-N(2))-methyltransferase RsmD [Actinomycetaceae bacterium L2_0104]